MYTVIFDIDGTIADIAHRRTHLEKQKPDWRMFNEGMEHDAPNPAIISLYRTLWGAGTYNIVLCTGRNERFREKTEAWLSEHGIPFNELFMRRDDDFRADCVIKEEFLDKMLTRGWEILFTVDDRQQVVDMWRRRGITCLQCAEGSF